MGMTHSFAEQQVHRMSHSVKDCANSIQGINQKFDNFEVHLRHINEYNEHLNTKVEGAINSLARLDATLNARIDLVLDTATHVSDDVVTILEDVLGKVSKFDPKREATQLPKVIIPMLVPLIILLIELAVANAYLGLLLASIQEIGRVYTTYLLVNATAVLFGLMVSVIWLIFYRVRLSRMSKRVKVDKADLVDENQADLVDGNQATSYRLSAALALAEEAHAAAAAAAEEDAFADDGVERSGVSASFAAPTLLVSGDESEAEAERRRLEAAPGTTNPAADPKFTLTTASNLGPLRGPVWHFDFETRRRHASTISLGQESAGSLSASSADHGSPESDAWAPSRSISASKERVVSPTLSENEFSPMRRSSTEPHDYNNSPAISRLGVRARQTRISRAQQAQSYQGLGNGKSPPSAHLHLQGISEYAKMRKANALQREMNIQRDQKAFDQLQRDLATEDPFFLCKDGSPDETSQGLPLRLPEHHLASHSPSSEQAFQDATPSPMRHLPSSQSRSSSSNAPLPRETRGGEGGGSSTNRSRRGQRIASALYLSDFSEGEYSPWSHAALAASQEPQALLSPSARGAREYTLASSFGDLEGYVDERDETSSHGSPSRTPQLGPISPSSAAVGSLGGVGELGLRRRQVSAPHYLGSAAGRAASELPAVGPAVLLSGSPGAAECDIHRL